MFAQTIIALTVAQQATLASLAAISAAVFSPYAYGAVGNGSTNDTTAINNMVAAVNAAGGGTVDWGKGDFLSNGGHVFTVPVQMRGAGCGGDLLANALTTVRTASATAKLFDFQANGCRIEGMKLLCTAATPTAGAGFYFTQGGGSRVYDCAVDGFWNNIDHENSREWYMSGCMLQGFMNDGVRIRNVAIHDGGDACISDCQIMGNTRNGRSAVRIESGGGVKITNTKINCRSGTIQHGIDVFVASDVYTVLLQVSNSSIENTSGSPIYARSQANGNWDMMTFTGVQTGTYGSVDVPAIDIESATGGSPTAAFGRTQIDGCIFHATAGRTARAIRLSNVPDVSIGIVNTFGYPKALINMAGTTLRLRNLNRDQATDTPLASGGTLTLDTLNFHNHATTLSGNTTLAVPNYPFPGMPVVLRILQPASGGPYTLNVSNTAFRFPGGAEPVLSTAASAEDMLVMHYDDNIGTWNCQLSKAYA